jgi:hypothetical protein
MPELLIPALFPHQQEDADRPERHKLARWGRRRGKSRMGFHVAVVGHGPTQPNGEPLWRGIAHGRKVGEVYTPFDVLWVGRSLKQASQIYTEEVRPRFKAAGGYTNDTDMIASCQGTGRIIVCSQDADSINNARGLGANLIGVIGDEVAHWDAAQDKWLEVLVPMLTDNFGWAWFVSTTEPGSWFNQLCEQTMASEKPGWYHSHGDARDNPRITPEAFDALVAEYPPNDPRLEKEVYARLTLGGGGLAFPEWRPDLHLASFQVPGGWRYVAGGDYGYSSAGAIEVAAIGPDDRLHFCLEYSFGQETAYDTGYHFGILVRDRGMIPEWLAFDPDPTFSVAVTATGGPTIGEDMQRGLNDALQRIRVPLIAAAKGPGSRLTRKLLWHEGLKYQLAPDGSVPPWGHPKWTIDAKACPQLAKTIPRLMLETKKLDGQEVRTEFVKKDGTEHWWDAGGYLAVSRVPGVDRPAVIVPENQHPGFRQNGQRRSRDGESAQQEYLDQLLSRGGQIPRTRIIVER